VGSGHLADGVALCNPNHLPTARWQFPATGAQRGLHSMPARPRLTHGSLCLRTAWGYLNAQFQKRSGARSR
jgi:hypothetical protein